MGTTQTPNMGLNLPNVSQETGPQFATDVNQAFTQVDQHNHSNGQGVPINSNGLAISQDLPLNTNNLTGVRTVRFNPGPATSGTDINCIYANSGSLFFNDNNGVVNKIGASGATAATTGIFNTIQSSSYLIANGNPIIDSAGNLFPNGRTANLSVNGSNQLVYNGNTIQNGSGNFLGINGTSIAPSYTFLNETNSGIYRIGLNNIGFSVAGTPVASLNTGTFNTSAIQSSGYLNANGNTIIDSAGNLFPNGRTANVSVNGSNQLLFNGNFLFSSSGGQLNTNSGQETTGSSSASLGNNFPATIGTPYKWIALKTSDGTQVYFPVWK